MTGAGDRLLRSLFLFGAVDGFSGGEKLRAFDTAAVGNSCEFRRKRSALDRLTGGDGLETTKQRYI